MSFDLRDQRIAELEQAVVERDAALAAANTRIAELEDRLNRNSSNSSLPPSANPPAAPKHPPKKPSGKKRGGQPGHKGHHRPMAEPDKIVPHRPECCAHCKAAFDGSERVVGDPVRHQVAEIPPSSLS